MYRIELRPGEVTVFRTIEELATGVRNGVISSKARIYHNASEKWLPIEFHPHYKQALELLSGRGSESSNPKPVERPRGEGLTFLNVPISPVTPLPSPAVRVPMSHLASPDIPLLADDGPAVVERRIPEPAGREPMVHEPVVREPTLHEPAVHERAVHELAVHEPMDHESMDHEPLVHEPAANDPMVHEPPVHEPSVHEPTARGLAVHEPVVREPVIYHRVADDPAVHEPEVEQPHAEPAIEEPALPWLTPRAPAIPPVSTSPVFELPKITYPEITPLQEPVAEHSSSTSRGKRRLQLAGALVLLAAGGFASTTLLSFGRPSDGVTATSTMADRPMVPAAARAITSPAVPSTQPSAPPPASRPAPKPRAAAAAPSTPAGGPATVAPGADGPLPPASSGFAPALESRAIVSAPPKSTAKPDAALGDSTAAPTIDMQVAAPAIPSAESLVGAPRQKGDSAMKKILRAVSGGKGPP
jgi:hypothetical protein